MKHSELRAIVHNAADSLGSGIGLMIGHYEMDVYGDAQRSRGGAITVDFLLGEIVEGEPSASLVESVALYREAFVALCAKSGCSVTDFGEAKARFWSDSLHRRFAVMVTDRAGRCSSTEYVGVPGRRVRILDALGRLRPKPSAL
ncbi:MULTISPECIES: hypothetical protein [unclassified Sphingomonas]|uniref:hypothetical protein n=1 Tax=unclassified Sphingomonas TaxID=196159 RepID=UPI000836FC9D|nr:MULTISPECIES: hypothetical protein [unclassified Sphingomonas]